MDPALKLCAFFLLLLLGLGNNRYLFIYLFIACSFLFFPDYIVFDFFDDFFFLCQ